MILRAAKIALVWGVAVYYTLVVFNNVTDYRSNYEFVRHVLMMDSTFPGNHGMWRALNSAALHTLFYLSIIGWELLTMVFCWLGVVALFSSVRMKVEAFHSAKVFAIIGLTLSLLQWLVMFLGIGGEWFLMWQSKNWNGQDAAFRMFTVVGIVLLFVVMPDTETQP
jgi:predicted small integral membrane protein